MTTIILLALAGTVIAIVVGTFWYSPMTPMGKLHMRYLGFDQLSPEAQAQKIAEAKPHMPKLYGAQMALSFLTAFFVVFVVTMSVQNGVPPMMAIAFPLMAWLCFTVPAVGGAILWSNCDRSIAWKKFTSDVLASLVTIVLVAFMAILFV